MITSITFRPVRTTRIMARMKMGKDWNVSETLMMVSALRVRKKPASNPSKVPATKEIAVAASPTTTSTRGAAITREKMSRPVSSVPNQCTGWGCRPRIVSTISPGTLARLGGGAETSGVGSCGS